MVLGNLRVRADRLAGPLDAPAHGPPLRTSWRDPVLASVTAATLLGVTGHRVRVEVHVGNGLPSF